jgi:hypothetical protein
VEEALLKTVAAAPAARKLKAAARQGAVGSDDPYERIEEALRAGAVSEQEAAALRAAEHACDEAIRVDAFPPETFGRAAQAIPDRAPLASVPHSR